MNLRMSLEVFPNVRVNRARQHVASSARQDLSSANTEAVSLVPPAHLPHNLIRPLAQTVLKIPIQTGARSNVYLASLVLAADPTQVPANVSQKAAPQDIYLPLADARLVLETLIAAKVNVCLANMDSRLLQDRLHAGPCLLRASIGGRNVFWHAINPGLRCA